MVLSRLLTTKLTSSSQDWSTLSCLRSSSGIPTSTSTSRIKSRDNLKTIGGKTTMQRPRTDSRSVTRTCWLMLVERLGRSKRSKENCCKTLTSTLKCSFSSKTANKANRAVKRESMKISNKTNWRHGQNSMSYSLKSCQTNGIASVTWTCTPNCSCISWVASTLTTWWTWSKKRSARMQNRPCERDFGLFWPHCWIICLCHKSLSSKILTSWRLD